MLHLQSSCSILTSGYMQVICRLQSQRWCDDVNLSPDRGKWNVVHTFSAGWPWGSWRWSDCTWVCALPKHLLLLCWQKSLGLSDKKALVLEFGLQRQISLPSCKRLAAAKDFYRQTLILFQRLQTASIKHWVFSQTAVGSEWDWVRLGPSHNSRSSCRLQACSAGQCVEIGKCADCSNMEWRGRGGVTVTELENLFKFDVI